jgi:hypothetical protein
LLCKQGVTGSIPVTSTNLLKVEQLGEVPFCRFGNF